MVVGKKKKRKDCRLYIHRLIGVQLYGRRTIHRSTFQNCTDLKTNTRITKVKVKSAVAM